MAIEEDIEQLKKWVQAIHDHLDLHEWNKDSRPWNSKEALHGKLASKKECDKRCDHHTEWVRCLCGAVKRATHNEFERAVTLYNGY